MPWCATGDLWVASMVTNAVEEVDARTLHLVRTVPVPTGPSGLAVSGGRIWVASVSAGDVTPITAASGVAGTPVRIPGGAVRVAAGFGALWVTGTTDTLSEVTPASSAVRSVTVGSGPIGVATGDGSVWVADAVSGTVAQVDPARLQVTRRFTVHGDPLAVAVSGGVVWVADGQADTVRTLSPGTGLAPRSLGATPRELVAVRDGVWVATANPGRILAASAT